jgi:hypothetical protein
MVPFCDIPANRLTSRSLQTTLNTIGYVLIRGLLPQREVRGVLGDICGVISRAGWLMSGSDPLERVANPKAACGDPDPSFKQTYQEVFNLPSLHALPHHPALRLAMSMIVGPRVLVHPKPIGRLIFPNSERLQVHAHQDYRFMQGDPECFTVWIPLHDCGLDVGPLQIMEGSQTLGFLPHDEEDLHVPELPDSATAGGTWAGGEIAAGDVLIFHSLTVHAALPNVSKQMRISIDCRFQDYERAIHPANLAFAGESGKSWEKTYSGWPSDDLKFYWKKLPLRLKPSKAELQELSLHATSPTVRAKSSRILSQLS